MRLIALSLYIKNNKPMTHGELLAECEKINNSELTNINKMSYSAISERVLNNCVNCKSTREVKHNVFIKNENKKISLTKEGKEMIENLIK
jgi:hypothetical protein